MATKGEQHGQTSDVKRSSAGLGHANCTQGENVRLRQPLASASIYSRCVFFFFKSGQLFFLAKLLAAADNWNRLARFASSSGPQFTGVAMFRPRISLRWFLLGTAGLSALIGLVIKPAYDHWQHRTWLAHQQWIAHQIDGNGNGVLMRDGVVVETHLGPRDGRGRFPLLENASELETLDMLCSLDDKEIQSLRGHSKLQKLMIWPQSPGITNDSLRVVGRLPELTGIVLCGTRIDDQGIAELGDLEKLAGLHIAFSPVRGYGFARLKSASRLADISLRGSVADDDGLIGLTGCKRLVWLDLSKTRVHGPGLVHLKGLPELQKLNLAGTRLTSGEAFGSLDQVVQLDLSETQLSPGVLRHLAGMDNLLRLNLTRSAMTDDLLAELEDVRQVKWLNLSHTNITDAGLVHLRKHPQLVSLDLRGTRVTDAALAKLRAEMPWPKNRKEHFEAIQPNRPRVSP
ncbi:MAG TPA: hypothetical protein VMP01_08755 [Pirellulaceae bacterium]|nr:hypothetical protein [Pirellulaceae bacterium]